VTVIVRWEVDDEVRDLLVTCTLSRTWAPSRFHPPDGGELEIEKILDQGTWARLPAAVEQDLKDDDGFERAVLRAIEKESER